MMVNKGMDSHPRWDYMICQGKFEPTSWSYLLVFRFVYSENGFSDGIGDNYPVKFDILPLPRSQRVDHG